MTTENTAANLTQEQIETELANVRKAKFAKLINANMSVMMQKRDEIVAMAKNPGLYSGALDEISTRKLEQLLDDIHNDISDSLATIKDFEPTDATPRALREKPKFSLFD